LTLVAASAVLAPIWREGYPWGSDTWGHLQRAAYLGDALREGGLWKGSLQGAWMPDWYMGDPTWAYYPPLTAWTFGALTAAVGDSLGAYRLLVTGIFVLLGLSVYWVGVRWGRDRWMAAAGAVLAVSAPYTLRTVFVEGNLPRGLALLPLPWIVWYTERILTQKRMARAFGWLAVLWAVTLVAHVMQAAQFAIVLAVYVLIRVLDNVYIPLRRGVMALAPVGLGAGLVAAYLLPAYSHAELANVPYLPAVKVSLFSISPSALLPSHASIEAISVGIATVVCAALLTLRTAEQHHKALMAASLVSIVLAFGPASGIYRLLPVRGQLLPERFLNASAVLMPVIIATTPLGMWKRRWAVVAVALILIIDARPAWRAVFMRPAPPDEQAVAEALARQRLAGRVADLTFPDPDASQLYLNTVVGQHANVSGWALENTPHHPAIRRLLSAVTESPQYLGRMLALWNADYVVARLDTPAEAEHLRSALNFQPVTSAGSLELWRRSAPSAFVQRLPDNRMLVIGDNPTSWLFAFPFATEGESADPGAYTRDYLDRFSVIGLTRLASDAELEPALEDWVREGHTLIVDLSGLGRLYDEGFTLFGVHALPLALNGDYAIRWPPGLDAMPGVLSFTTPEGPWVGATYYGVDETLASLTQDGESYPVLGRQQVGDGQIWFVGFNLIYLLQQSNQMAAVQQLTGYLLADTGVDRDLALPAFDVTPGQRTPTSLSFSYTSDSATSVVVSMTYFPRWRAALDGAPLDIGSHEHLMLLNLPAGTHTVTLRYFPLGTPIAWWGWAVTALCVGVTGLVSYRLGRRPVLAAEDRVGAFNDRLPQAEVSPTTGYTVCPNCSFQLARTGPPNEHSYPFASLDCPICGYSLGRTEFVASVSLSDGEKHALAKDWMRRSHLTERQLLDQFNLAADELFEPKIPAIDPGSDPAVRTIQQLSSLAAGDHGLADNEQPPAPSEAQPRYTSCRNCGFRLAHVHLEATSSLPFAQDCPICGFSPGRVGFVPSGTLSRSTKRLLAEAWIRRANLTKDLLVEQFGLTLDELFEPEVQSDSDLPEAR
jgi:hypothetical protein